MPVENPSIVAKIAESAAIFSDRISREALFNAPDALCAFEALTDKTGRMNGNMVMIMKET
jgi:hypothetical protein